MCIDLAGESLAAQTLEAYLDVFTHHYLQAKNQLPADWEGVAHTRLRALMDVPGQARFCVADGAVLCWPPRMGAHHPEGLIDTMDPQRVSGKDAMIFVVRSGDDTTVNETPACDVALCVSSTERRGEFTTEWL